MARTLAARKDTLDAGIASAARTFDNAARATAQLGPVIDRIGRSADAVEKMGDEVARTSASAGKTVDSVGADVKRFTAETLPELERLLGELSVLATSLRRLSEQTERDPRRCCSVAGLCLPGRVNRRSKGPGHERTETCPG